MPPIRICVLDEHEIFRRGLVACLSEDPSVEVVHEGAPGSLPDEANAVDVGVVSASAAREPLPCPLVVCSPEATAPPQSGSTGNRVLAVLRRSALTPGQLIGAVHAAAAGLHVNEGQSPPPGGLNGRLLEVLRLLADGADTQAISQSLNYSERTIKGLISEVERELGARSRAQAVALGIRNGLI